MRAWLVVRRSSPIVMIHVITQKLCSTSVGFQCDCREISGEQLPVMALSLTVALNMALNMAHNYMVLTIKMLAIDILNSLVAYKYDFIAVPRVTPLSHCSSLPLLYSNSLSVLLQCSQ